MEYSDRKDGDIWQKFREAKAESILLNIKDVNAFAASEILDSLGGKVNSYSDEKTRIHFSVARYGRKLMRTAVPFFRIANLALYENAITIADYGHQRKIETASRRYLDCKDEEILYPHTPEIDDNFIAQIKHLFSASSLWIDQKVAICHSAVERLFFPNRWTDVCIDHTKNNPDWRRYYTSDHEWKHVCQCGRWHHYDLTNEEWEDGGREKVTEALFEAYLREIQEIDSAFPKIDFSCFEKIFGDDFSFVIKATRASIISDEILRMNNALASIKTSVDQQIQKQRELALNYRKAITMTYRTCDEAIDLCIVDAKLRRHNDRISSFFDILDKIF